ncbi:hypothetical protein D3A96_07850 [Robertkochia marina]|nr:hypothetical protein D3A96_07850 [Robertkochia marina]
MLKVENSGEFNSNILGPPYYQYKKYILGGFLFLRKENRNGNVPVFLCPYLSEACFSERLGIKKPSPAKAGTVFFARPPVWVLERSEKPL